MTGLLLCCCRVSCQLGGSGWESNPPESAPQPPNGFEDRAAHRDRTTPSNVISEAR